MTTNVIQSNSCQFVARFVDANGNIIVPSGAILSISYPTGLTFTSTSITMSPVNSFFTATWFSSVSDLGAATWTISASGGSSTIIQSDIQGDLRIIFAPVLNESPVLLAGGSTPILVEPNVPLLVN